jgi:hypothetical protein
MTYTLNLIREKTTYMRACYIPKSRKIGIELSHLGRKALKSLAGFIYYWLEKSMINSQQKQPCSFLFLPSCKTNKTDRCVSYHKIHSHISKDLINHRKRNQEMLLFASLTIEVN